MAFVVAGWAGVVSDRLPHIGLYAQLMGTELGGKAANSRKKLPPTKAFSILAP
jgi:hypothetical protein